MHKIIHPLFEFDLTPYKISTVEDNYWFSDRFFTKYSFPFSFKLKDDLLVVFGALLDDNAKFIETEYEVQYVLGNQLENAVFQIESQIGETIEATFRYGFDELPNFDKKLSELPLHEETITDIYTHAPTIIPQKWPSVNYNYPQVYTDKYDKTTPTWEEFKGIINNYISGAFLVNTYDEINFANLNIIQPVPYLLHVLVQGFLDAGFTLKGDFLNSSLIKKILLFTDIDYFDLRGNIQDFKVLRSEYDSQPSADVVNYSKSLELSPGSTYKITGLLCSYSKFLGFGNPSHSFSFANISYKGNVLTGVGTTTSLKAIKEIDVTFQTDSDTNVLTQILEFNAGGYSQFIQPDELIYDLKIERVLENSPSEVRMFNKVKLTEVVPDRTFGELVTECKKYFNLEVNPIGNDIYMNFLEDQINYNDAIDLTNFEVLKPKREFNKLKSKLLKFKNPGIKSSFYLPVYQDKNQIVFNELNVTDLTDKIELDILPLPQKSEFFVETAHLFEYEGNNKMYFMLYDGLQNTRNITVDPDELLLPNIHSNYHQNWFSFLLNAIGYTWLFKMFLEQVVKIKKKCFAYGRYMVIKSIDKTQVSEDLFEVEIEAETIE